LFYCYNKTGIDSFSFVTKVAWLNKQHTIQSNLIVFATGAPGVPGLSGTTGQTGHRGLRGQNGMPGMPGHPVS
jgi:hypothetical protein